MTGGVVPTEEQYVTIGVADDLFAAPVYQVREILAMQPISRLPHAPLHVLGITDVRGQSIPVVDLRLTVGLPQRADDDATRIIILLVALNGEIRTVGLRADRVYDVTGMDPETLDAPPDQSIGIRRDVIAGIGRRNGRLVAILALDRFFADVREVEGVEA